MKALPFTEEPGPIHQLREDASPLEFFHLLWEPSFFQLLADQTNLYARQKQATRPNPRWYPISSEEMKAFVGVNIIMGIDQKPEISSYWSTDEYLGNKGGEEGLSQGTLRRTEQVRTYVPPPERLRENARKGPARV